MRFFQKKHTLFTKLGGSGANPPRKIEFLPLFLSNLGGVAQFLPFFPSNLGGFVINPPRKMKFLPFFLSNPPSLVTNPIGFMGNPPFVVKHSPFFVSNPIEKIKKAAVFILSTLFFKI